LIVFTSDAEQNDQTVTTASNIGTERYFIKTSRRSGGRAAAHLNASPRSVYDSPVLTEKQHLFRPAWG
jgi:hypothetical protein